MFGGEPGLKACLKQLPSIQGKHGQELEDRRELGNIVNLRDLFLLRTAQNLLNWSSEVSDIADTDRVSTLTDRDRIPYVLNLDHVAEKHPNLL